jgi:hypothetical protein
MSSAQFHRGLSRELRRIVRAQGIALDEHSAQVVLAGSTGQVTDLAQQVLIAARNQVLNAPVKQRLMRAWERDHPGANPFPPPFLQMVLNVIRKALAEDRDNAELRLVLADLQDKCVQELASG